LIAVLQKGKARAQEESSEMGIDVILPPGVCFAEVVGAVVVDAKLFPEEAATLGLVHPTRRREFSLGRSCARRALGDLGLPPGPILVGARGEPLWPRGIVGSITHCADYCGAAVAKATRFAGIGIDAEVNDVLPDDLLALITNDLERKQITALANQEISWGRVLFSIKESIYKAFFPITRKWLEFGDVSVTICPEGATFRATSFIKDLIRPIYGRFIVSPAHIITVAIVPLVTNQS
jgi:enterobactin synthetase component D / holo-[acyl-carrier protein] synthase